MATEIRVKIQPIQEQPYELVAIQVREAFDGIHNYESSAEFLSKVFPEGW
jgi:hypothetical protein